jgi:hypothetical protein
LPFRSALNLKERPLLGRFQGVFERDLIEQSAGERLVKAVFAAGLLWLAIWWASS